MRDHRGLCGARCKATVKQSPFRERALAPSPAAEAGVTEVKHPSAMVHPLGLAGEPDRVPAFIRARGTTGSKPKQTPGW